jgi:hypothetical protein
MNRICVAAVILLTTAIFACASFAGEIAVRSATYGPNCGAPAGNATDEVQSVCGGKESCDYDVEVSKLGDPAGGCAKDFTVEYVCSADSAAKTTEVPNEANGNTARLSCL